MSQRDSRAAFDSLVAKSHVQYALIQQEGKHNEIPMSLATISLLGGTAAQMQAIYNTKSVLLQSWVISPGRITNLEDREKHLGDVRFQRAYMDYFSLQHSQMKGNAQALALDQLLAEPKPLIYGLFGGFGRSFLLLSDAVEIQSPILAVESLVLASVDWSNEVFDLLRHLQFASFPEVGLTPEVILHRVAHDGRFSGLMRSGPGFHNVSFVLSNATARTALIDYVHQLDLQNLPDLLDQLAHLAAQLLCGAHKKDRPAFDFYLSFPVSFMHGLRVLLPISDDEQYSLTLIRGVWLLILLSYITQLRPCLDATLITSIALQGHQNSWDSVYVDFRAQANIVAGNDEDIHVLRVLRSLYELAKVSPSNTGYFLQAAWKLKLHWHHWTGFGNPREDSLNIRL